MPVFGPRLPRISFRRLDGIVLLDKPAGMSSNAALQAARRLFRAEKGGHTGSLDPLATGLLPLCFGEATKLAGLLLGSAKAYEAEIVLGVSTDSDDADGAVLRTRPVPRERRTAFEEAACAVSAMSWTSACGREPGGRLGHASRPAA
jgi:tRNA pseudouridine55 synthase